MKPTIVGKRFGKLAVVRRTSVHNNASIYECLCECGKTIEAYRSNLVRDKSPQASCGCSLVDKDKSLIGKRFGMLTVNAYVERRSYIPFYLCDCACGKQIEVSGTNLKRYPGTKSCGCSRHRNTRLMTEMLGRYKAGARNRGLTWDLSKEQFFTLVSLPCHYCGTEGSTAKQFAIGKLQCNGIDRKNSGDGYNTMNCVPCCRFCNRAKGGSNYEEFLAYLERLVLFQAASLEGDSMSSGLRR